MCDVCGCGDPNKLTIDVHASLLSENDHEAAHLREHFVSKGVLALNLMGSPGSGKTALVEAIAGWLSTPRSPARPPLRLAAVSGDLATSLDAERLARAGVPSATITTGSACHLDASMVHHALHGAVAAAVDGCDVFFIENVGNLVCPAIYDLGEAARVVALSVTEGVDKPLKYPAMFRGADLVVLTKTDLLPHLPSVSLAELHANLARVMPAPRTLEVSATSGAGVGALVAWLESLRDARPGPRAEVDHPGPQPG